MDHTLLYWFLGACVFAIFYLAMIAIFENVDRQNVINAARQYVSTTRKSKKNAIIFTAIAKLDDKNSFGQINGRKRNVYSNRTAQTTVPAEQE